MKIFETLHLVLLAALVIGVPVAVGVRPPGQEFSIAQGLKQGAIVAALLSVLLVLNLLLARRAARAHKEDRYDETTR